MLGPFAPGVHATLALICLWSAPAEAANRLGIGFTYSVEVAAPNGARVRLHAEEAGEGAPLLFLHGLGASTFTWRKIAPDLARDHRVIALDMKGFGASDKPLDSRYAAEDQAALVAAFIRKRDLTKLTVVGHSFGGLVALLAATEFERTEPGSISRLVIMDAPALPQPFPGLADAIEAPLVSYGLLGVTLPEVLARTMLTFTRRLDNPPSEEDIAGYAEPFYDLGARHAFIETARSVVATNARGYAARLRKLNMPVLLVWCRSDEIVPLATGRKLARVLPNARLVVLQGCNHLPQDERPAAFIARLRSFLGR